MKRRLIVKGISCLLTASSVLTQMPAAFGQSMNESADYNWENGFLLDEFGTDSLSETSYNEPISLELPSSEPASPETSLEESTSPELPSSEPASLEPSLEEPTSPELSSSEPASLEPSSEEPTSPELSSSEPTSLEPSLEEPTSPELSSSEPASLEPSLEEPVSSELPAEETTLPEESSEESSSEESSSEETSEENVLENAVEKKEFMDGYVLNACEVYSGWKQDQRVITNIPAGQEIFIIGRVYADGEPVWAHVTFQINEYCYEGYIKNENCTGQGIMSLALSGDISSFPASYQEKLSVLQAAHPNWNFVPIFVGDTFDYAIGQEMSIAGHALVSMSFPTYLRSRLERDYNAATYTWTEWEPGWAGASETTVRYYMDPRNFLNEEYIFMFEQLDREFQSVEAAVEQVLSGTFMSYTNVPGETYTYAWLFNWIGEQYHISPLALASRVRQEQGAGTSDLISGTYSGYENLYNYFNMEATGSTREQIVTNGLAEAKRGSSFLMPDGSYSEGSWNTPAKSIIGGALKFSQLYIKRNQNTLYAQKFDYDASYDSKYWHQYMTNIMAPFSECQPIKRAYAASGLIDEAITFYIPVYDDMPESSPYPEEEEFENGEEYPTVYDGTDYAAVYDAVWYMNQYPDLKEAFSTDYGALLRHFVVSGIGEGRQACEDFSVTIYKANYADLREAFGDDNAAYVKHYLTYGMAEGRNGKTELPEDGSDPEEENPTETAPSDPEEETPAETVPSDPEEETPTETVPSTPTVYEGVDYAPVFDADYYLNRYSDLKAVYGTDAAAALKHYANWGIEEGRRASENFSIAFYKNNYEDLREAFGDDNRAYVMHFINYGQAENRSGVEQEVPGGTPNPNPYSTIHDGLDYAPVFDAEYYLNKYSDLKKAFGTDYAAAFQHFINYGIEEGRQAKANFNVTVYKTYYLDLIAAFGNDNMKYVQHYIKHGQQEGRKAV